MTIPGHEAATVPIVATDEADAVLVARISGGGPDARTAWPVLVARHSARMYAVARSFGLDQATSEDLVQTAWLRLLERGEQLRESASVGAWLCTVVRNEALRLLTRRREVPGDETVAARLPAVVEDGADGLVSSERAAALRLAFARLGPECRQLLLLVIADPPLGYDAIAAALGRPRGSLGPTRRRCLDRLRELLPAGFDDDVSTTPPPGSRRRHTGD